MKHDRKSKRFRKLTENLHERMRPYLLAGDETEDYVCSNNNYEWYYSYAATVCPTRILEIGARMGYSAIAMVMGFPRVEELVLIDNGSYGFNVAEAAKNVKKFAPSLRIRELDIDTRSVNELPLDGEFDIIHVDGDHSHAGAVHDLNLALPLLSDRGLIVVDDIDSIGPCRRGTDDFLACNRDLSVEYIPTFRGHLLIARRESVFLKSTARPRIAGTSSPLDIPAAIQRGIRADMLSRRDFFKKAGRGSLTLGGIAVAGISLSLLGSGCSDDDGPTSPNGYQ